MANETMRTYVVRRLGNHTHVGALLREMVVRAFTAPTLAGFWRYWNPVYGYFLGRYIYRPLCRAMPKPLAAVLTFAFCGFFLHDLLGPWLGAALSGKPKLPFALMWFTLMGLAMVLGTACRLRLDRVPAWGRVAFHSAIIAGCFSLAFRGQFLVP